uniref:Uncharacterized protein n=1 Tax=Rhizophora mucronata TaxID=61149 RepID=A0A2P2KA22_RHIMU
MLGFIPGHRTENLIDGNESEIFFKLLR